MAPIELLFSIMVTDISNIIKRLYNEVIEEFRALDKQHYFYAGTTRSPYGQTYLTSDDKDSSYEKKLVKAVNKNLNKKPYSKDPPTMGISLKGFLADN